MTLLFLLRRVHSEWAWKNERVAGVCMVAREKERGCDGGKVKYLAKEVREERGEKSDGLVCRRLF
jgi:hypothetical protein